MKSYKKKTIFHFAWMHAFVWFLLFLNFNSLVSWKVFFFSIIGEKITYLRKNSTFLHFHTVLFTYWILGEDNEYIFRWNLYLKEKSCASFLFLCMLLSFICNLFIYYLLLNLYWVCSIKAEIPFNKIGNFFLF